jgi:hypothetical protein
VDSCQHESHVRKGEIRCKKCHAYHRILPGGARWVATTHRGGYPKGKPRHQRPHHDHRTDA